MNYSTHTNVDFLATYLLKRWVPKWYSAFPDPATGGFYERLGEQFTPRTGLPRRLLTQCRQLAMYAHAYHRTGGDFAPDLERHFESLVAHYFVPETGGWRFSVDDTGAIADSTYDLYSLSFVIFAMAHYYAATGDERAYVYAVGVVDFINRTFTMPNLPGYAEAVDVDLNIIPRQRRQNPHMHLLEACLFAFHIWDDELFKGVADTVVELFYNHFYIREQNQLCEFLTDDLKPDPIDGARVEPGHYYEWVWLLKKHAAFNGNPIQHDDVCEDLLSWANTYGWDTEYGGIYDVLSPNGSVLADTKRLWPFTEALKANALMLDQAGDDGRAVLKAKMEEMTRVFSENYMADRGFWVEWLNRDLTPAVDYMPGTTPYHVYFGIMETYDVMRARGRSMSWRSGVLTRIYRARRTLSDIVRNMRDGMKKSG